MVVWHHGALWKWFQCYLTDRINTLPILTTCPLTLATLTVTSGVPQGSVLGPLLFIVYTNDLPIRLQSNVFSFADDTNLLQAITSFNNPILQNDLDTVLHWCLEWKLRLNESKCKFLSFSLKSSAVHSQYSVNGLVIDEVDTHRDLSILVSSNLSWSPHISKVCSSAYQSLYFIRRNISSSKSPPNMLKSLYISLVRSRLLYCCQLWTPRCLNDIGRLETIQRQATRHILHHSFPNFDYKERLIHLHLLPLMYHHDLLDIMFLAKCLKHPPPNFTILEFVSFSSHKTRSSSHAKLKVNFRRLSTTWHFHFNRVVRTWNSLPESCLDLSLPLPVIRQRIMEHFWDHFTSHFNSNSPCTYHYICPCSNCHIH